MTDAPETEAVKALVRTRQVRDFTSEPLTDAQIEALTEVARWSGSSRNSQPWRFIVVRDPGTLARLHEAGLPQTKSLRTAQVAIAITLPVDAGTENTFDEGRAAERLLVAAGMLGLAAGIAWVRKEFRDSVAEILGLPADRFVRTIVAVGHASEAGQRPKSAPGTARLPASETIFKERWPQG